jgi:threonine dehydrogenase-like Zn-dependent dehydrogenase
VLDWEGVKQMRLREEAEPSLRPGWVVIDVKAVGICGSEIAAFTGGNELRKPPLVMGHEFSGTVSGVGERVPAAWMGKTVTVNPLISCQTCRFCRDGERHLCPERQIVGVHLPGAFAEKVAVPVSNCFPVTSPLSGALVEPLATGLRSVERSGVRAGDDALVFGAGMIGLASAKLLRARGALRCVVVDTISSRLAWASKWGATQTINASKDDVGGVLKELAPEGFDCVVDAVGASQTRIQSITAARRGGRVVFVGLHETNTELPSNYIIRNEIEIMGTFAYSDDDFRRALALVEGNFVDTSGGWLDVRSLASGQAAFTEQATGPGTYSKIILRPSLQGE